MLNKKIGKFFSVIICLLFITTNTALGIEGYSDVIEETSSIIHLPENTVKGKVNLEIRGNTLANGLGDGLTGWTVSDGSSTMAVVDNKIEFSGNPWVRIEKNNILDINKYYVLRFCGKLNDTATVENYNIGVCNIYDTYNLNKSTWTTRAVKLTNKTKVSFHMQSARQQFKLKDIAVFEVSLDEYNNLTEQQLLDKYPYVSGIQGSLVHNIKTLTHNLAINESVVLPPLGANRYGGIIVPKFKVEPNGKYEVSGIKEYGGVSQLGRVVAMTYDSNDNLLSEILLGDSGRLNGGYYCGKFHAPSNADWCEIKQRNYNTSSPEVKYYNIQVEKITDSADITINNSASYATPYTPYDEHEENIGVELHGFNGVHDQLVGSTVIRRIKKVALDGNGFVFSSNLTDDAKKIIHSNFTPYTGRETPCILADENGIARTSYVGGYGSLLHWSDSALYITIPNSVSGWSTGYTPTTQDIKILFSKKPHVLYYVAKEDYYETEQLINPSLIAQPNGTIVIDNSTKFAAMYNNGLTIENKDLPIEHIEKVYKIKDGTKTSIDLNKVSIANGQEVTIYGALNGEIYEVSYKFPDKLTTIPTVRYSVPINLQGQINGNTEIVENNNKLIQEIQNRLQILRQQMGL